jgi:hypothetical protein
MEPRARYDRQAQAITVEFEDADVQGTVAFPDEDHLADLGADGHVVALEILSPNDLKLEEMAERFGLVERLRELEAVVARAMAPWTGVASAPTVTIVQGSVALGFGPQEPARSASETSARELDLLPS